MTESTASKAAQGQDCRLIESTGINYTENGRRKFDGETSDGVPCSFTYSFLAFQSNLTIKIVAPEAPDNTKTLSTYKYNN